MRDYGVDGQLGLEKTPEQYIAKFREIMLQVKRVLRTDGTVWWNIGDTYGGSWQDYGSRDGGQRSKYTESFERKGSVKELPPTRKLRPKCLLMMPERFAFMMLDIGFTLRNKIIWQKPNPMPSSVKDRFTTTWEYVYLFSKSKCYYFDLDAVRKPHKNRPQRVEKIKDRKQFNVNQQFNRPNREIGNFPLGKNPSDFVRIVDVSVLTWLAALIDGEGSITISEKNRLDKKYKSPEFNLYIEIGGKNKALIETAYKIFNKGYFAHRIQHGDSYWRLAWSGNIALNVLKQVEPYLIAKRRQARLAIEFQSTKTRVPFKKTPDDVIEYRRRIRDEIRMINRTATGSLDYSPEKFDVWSITTQPFKGAHFAVFPERLCETPIKAGCPKAICNKCGKPRVRITKYLEQPKSTGKGKAAWERDKEEGKIARMGGTSSISTYGKKFTGAAPRKTIGFTDCGCKAGFSPGIVLDPFSGSGTACLVAKKLGRNYIGIDLKKEYCEMARARLAKIPQRLDSFINKECDEK